MLDGEFFLDEFPARLAKRGSQWGIVGQLGQAFLQLGQVARLDEVAGFVVAMAFLPVKLWVVVIAFAIFRLLDILKPPPIDWIERRFKGGIAIVADDVVAGLLTNAVVHLLLLLVGSP